LTPEKMKTTDNAVTSKYSALFIIASCDAQGYRICFWHGFVQARQGLNINSPPATPGVGECPKEERRRRSILNPAGVLWIKVMH
jgi:hypothetical protein